MIVRAFNVEAINVEAINDKESSSTMFINLLCKAKEYYQPQGYQYKRYRLTD
jgi:hypothetical protein